jgi:hypothetical protein
LKLLDFWGAEFMLECMKTRIQTLFHSRVSVLRERWSLQLEYLALRQQVEV